MKNFPQTGEFHKTLKELAFALHKFSQEMEEEGTTSNSFYDAITLIPKQIKTSQWKYRPPSLMNTDFKIPPKLSVGVPIYTK